MIQLRDYQRRALDETRVLARNGHRAVCIVLPTGGGKSVLVTAAIESHLTKGGKGVVVVVHRLELVRQMAAHLRNRLPHDDVGLIVPGADASPHAPVQVSTIQTLLARGITPPASLLVFDECFPAGTLIGDRPIESLRPGDLVRAFDHHSHRVVTRRVLRAARRPAPATLITLRTGGYSLTCTPDHPIYTRTRGYVRAEALADAEEILLSLDRAVLGVPETSTDCDAHRTSAMAQSSGGLLLGRVSDGAAESLARSGDGPDQPTACQCADADAEPDAQLGGAGEDGPHAAHDRAPAGDPGGQWPGADHTADVAPSSTRSPMGAGAHARRACPATSRDAEVLPPGPGSSNGAPGDRGRWGEPRGTESPSRRCAKGQLLAWVRLDGAPVHEPHGADGPGDGFVYNLEVEEHHNYFANGFLVHNCHHYVADEWQKFHAAYAGVFTIGLTATPERMDGRPLGDMFDGLVVGAHYSELLAGGHLVPCTTYAPETGEKLASGVALDPVDAYLKFAGGERGFLFTNRVDTAELLAKRFCEVGVPAAAISERTPKGDRARIMAEFKAGDLRLLTNVAVLTEGVDVPDAAVCVLASPCSHQGGFLQKVGRVLRPAPGKTHARLIDLVGAVFSHGLPTEDRAYNLDGDEGISREADAIPALSTCQACGCVYPAGRKCPACGFAPAYEPPTVVVHNIALREVYAGKLTPTAAKRSEFDRLVALAKRNRWSLGWVAKEYLKLFEEEPLPYFQKFDRDEKRAEYERLLALATEKGFQRGWAAHRYRALFGVWPRFA